MNEYSIVEKMAVGSFGVVFKVRRAIDDGVFVMKRINFANFQKQQRLDAIQEIRVMSRLAHPFIVAQRDAFLFNRENLCIIMDYYGGGDLDDLISKHREMDEYLPFERVMKWFVSVCFAMQYLHAQGIVHRDLKTNNIFLDLQSQEVAVGDFGMAEILQSPMDSAGAATREGKGLTGARDLWAETDDAPTSSVECSSSFSISDDELVAFNGAVRGTPLYMSPENLEKGICSPSSDVWSLGCILYELLSLRHPFESRDIAALMMRVTAGARQPLPAHYPPEIVELVDRMLSLDPARRPSCEEILRSPAMSSFVYAVVTQHVPHDAPDSIGEQTFASQQQHLGIRCDVVPHFSVVPRADQATIPPSRERALAEERAAAGARDLAKPLFSASTVAGTRESSLQALQSLPSCHRESGLLFSSGGVSTGVDYCAGNISNVDDMRDRPIAQLKEEVAWYRRLVQSEMRVLKQRRDIVAQRRRVGGDSSVVSGSSVTEIRQCGHSRSRSSPWLPSLAPWNRGKGCAPRQVLQNQSKHSSPRQGGTTDISNADRNNRTMNVRDNGEAVAFRGLGTLEASLLARRQHRWDVTVKVLGVEVLQTIYSYYKSVDVAERDATLVMQIVPDRAQWHVLPEVEEIVVLDRLLEGSAISTSL
uniref:non-specific serine/threonine protein kinase n=1 Tax=Trypanosoma congolense (strain IL3000) TaxID=1068625 RepID=G0URC5_TRYCI|nr:putative serine/threonine-protein kinase [Trypanosoma congolense IL3000]